MMTSSSKDSRRDAGGRFGAELRRLRQRAGYTQESLARTAGYSRVYITLVENGHNSPGDEFVRLVGEALDARLALESLHRATTREASGQQADSPPLPIEVAVQDVEITHEPAGGVRLTAAGPKPENHSWSTSAGALRSRSWERPLPLSSINPTLPIEALAGRSSTSSATPIEHLRLMYQSLVESDNLFGSAHTLQGTHDQLRVIEQLCAETTGADRRDLLLLRAQFAESMAWLTQDHADYEVAWRWTDRALEWSHLAADPLLTAIVLIRKSQVAADSGDGPAAIDYATAAAELAPPDTRLPAVSEVCAAHGHALLGNRAASDRAYDTARDRVATLEVDPMSSWGAWLDHAYIDAQQARSLAATGQHAESILTFDRAISALPEGYPRERGVHLARAARACTSADELDEAARLASQALEIGVKMKSGRIDTELQALLRDVDRVETEPVVEFRERARAVELV